MNKREKDQQELRELAEDYNQGLKNGDYIEPKMKIKYFINRKEIPYIGDHILYKMATEQKLEDHDVDIGASRRQ